MIYVRLRSVGRPCFLVHGVPLETGGHCSILGCTQVKNMKGLKEMCFRGSEGEVDYSLLETGRVR
jgi:hypothetical protein